MATVPTHLWEESSLYLSHYFNTLQPEIRLPRRGLSGRHLNCSRPGTMMLQDLAIRSRRLLQTLNRRSWKSRMASRPLLGPAEDKGHWSGSLVDDSPWCGSCSVFTLPCLPSPGLTLPARDWQCTALLHSGPPGNLVWLQMCLGMYLESLSAMKEEHDISQQVSLVTQSRTNPRRVVSGSSAV